MDHRMNGVSRAAPALLSIALVACGGGGGGSDTNPAPPPPPSYTVGGAVNGLAGSGLTLQNNGAGDLMVPASGAFNFANGLAGGAAYNVTVSAQPSNPSQTCTVTSGAGHVGSANVSSVAVNCITNSFTVSGTASGVVGTGLSLSLNGGASLPIAGDGAFEFPDAVLSGEVFEVSISSSAFAPAQRCELTNASGSITSTAVANVGVNCTIGHTQYALVTDQQASTLSAFAVDATTGQMRLQSYSHTELGAVGLAYDAANSRAYVANQSVDEITAYDFDLTTGTLTLIPGAPVPAGDAPQDVVFDPSGRYLLAPNLLSGDISVYSVTAATGALAPVPGSPFPLAAGSRPADLVFDAAGRILFVTDAAGDAVWGFTFDAASGALQTIAGSPFLCGADNPVDLELSRDGRFLLVANSLSDEITVFSVDGTSGALSPVAGSPFAAGDSVRALSFDPSGRFVYAANGASDNLFTFSFHSGTGALTEVSGSRVATGDEPSSVRVDPKGEWLFVSNGRSSTVSSYRIDMSTGIPALERVHAARRDPSEIELIDGAQPFDIAVRQAYVANTGSDDVSVVAVDPEQGTLSSLGEVPAGDGPGDITLHPGGLLAYVTNFFEENIQSYTIRVDGTLEVNGSPTPAGDGPHRLLIEASGRWAYGSSAEAGLITIYDIDASNGRLTARAGTVSTGADLVSLAMDPAGHYLFAAVQSTNEVRVYRIDAAGGSLTLVGTPLELGQKPHALSMNAAGDRLYVTELLANTVTSLSIDRSTGALTALGVPEFAGSSPRAVAVRPVGNEAYTANYDSDTLAHLTVLPSGLLTHADDTDTRDGPVDLAIDGEGRFMFVVHALQGSLSAHELISGEPREAASRLVGRQPARVVLRETVAAVP